MHIAVFIRSDIPARRRPDLECKALENITYEVILNSTKWCIVCIYRPSNMNDQTFSGSITTTLDKCITHYDNSRLVICTSRTVGSAKKFVRITSSFGGGEFTKTLRKVCTCQILKFAFLLLEYCKIRECYAVANAFTIRNMHCLLLYMKCSSPKINRPTKNMTTIVILLHF